MPSTGLDSFDTTVQETNLVLKEIENEFGWQGRRDQSYDALRAVLQALRDRLTVDEGAQFAAQLPMLIKGIYYDGWDPSIAPKRIDREEFLQQIRKQFPYSLKGGLENLVSGVLRVLRKHVSIGEAQDIVSTLPKDIRSIVNEFVSNG